MDGRGLGQGLLIAFYAAIGLGVVGGGIVVGGAMWLWPDSNDIKTTLEEKTNDFARHGAVTPDMACAEIVKFNTQLNEQFASEARSGKIVSQFSLSSEDCLKVLKPQAAPQP